MKTGKIARPQIRRLGLGLLVTMLLAAQVGPALAEIIPPERRITWEGNVGVAGDIPNRTAICATLSPLGGTQDDTPAIQSAINSCGSGQVVKLGPGTFRVTQIKIMKSNVTLRGSGMGVTVLKGTSNTAPSIVGVNWTGADWDLNSDQTFNVASGYTKGSTNITTTAAHNWTAGDLILIDQANNPSANPPITSTGVGGVCSWCGRWGGKKPAGQVAKVIAVPTPTTARLEIPLYWTFDRATVQATRLPGVVTGVGIEDLTIDNTSSWNDKQANQGTLALYFVQNSWVLRTEVHGEVRAGIALYGTYRTTVRSSSVHKSKQYTSNNGYGIFLMPASSASLIEDNRLYDLTSGIELAGAISGNVISYNYVKDLKDTNFPNAVRYGANNHGAHPFMNLLEGNFFDGSFIATDSYWGSSSHNTFLRNKVAIDTSKTNEAANMRFFKANWYMNVVGNVLGTAGNETLYQGGSPYGTKLIYELDTAGGALGAADGQTKATILRHGNWDAVNKQVLWDSKITDQTIPRSYYLSAKPAFFGSCAWPAIGADLSPMLKTLPAQARFQGSAICSGSSLPSLQAPANLRVLP